MKLTILLFFSLVLGCLSAETYSQMTKLSVVENNTTLLDVIRTIEKQSEFKFFYNEKVDINWNISVDLTDKNIFEVLDKVLESSSIKYKVIGKQIALYDKHETEPFLSESNQKLLVSGIVTDASNGEAIPGVNVVIKGTTIGTISGTDGKYSLPLTDRNSILVFSFIGYITQEVSVNGRTNVNVSLVSQILGLDEIVVIGYGTIRKRDITAAISNIDVSTLADIPATNVGRLLVGQSSGVYAKQTTGAPGEELEIIVRGLGSISAGAYHPLYVIDGFPIGNSIGKNINSNDIESITILKDAVSTAIYGARGANGVVLITTKGAKEGESKLSFNASFGIQNVPDSRKYEMLTGKEFAQFKKDVFTDAIRALQHREPSLEEIPLDFRYPEETAISTNWYDAILNKSSKLQDYNLTFSEGKGNLHSLFSISYVDQDGILINTNYDNYSINGKFDGRLNEFINYGLNFNASHVTQDHENPLTASGGEFYYVVGASLLADPREPIYNEDGSYNSYIGGHDGVYGFYNPVQYLNEKLKRSKITNLLSNGFIELSFLKNFKFKSLINARLNYDSYKEFSPSTVSGVQAPAPRDATELDQDSRLFNYSADQLLSYDNEFASNRINLLIGFTAQRETVNGLQGSGSAFSSDLTPFLGSASIKSTNSWEYGWSMMAFFSRLNYSLKDKYLFSATFRREGSSRFGENNRYGNFPAASIGWRISGEPFMSGIPWIDDLKLRASWGTTGNNNIGNYTHLAYMNRVGYILGNNFASGYQIGSFANAELGWEISKQLDLGFDLSAFNNHLTLIAEYYNRITSDMLLEIPVPAISGYTSSIENVGKVRNRGFEFNVGYRTNIRKVELWSNINVSFNNNKIISLRSEDDEIWKGYYWNGFNVSKVGRPIAMIYGYKVLGIFDNQQEIDNAPTQAGAIPGDLIYLDANNDGMVTSDTKDMLEIGNPWPKCTYGITIGGSFKNFDLSILMNGALKYDIYNRLEQSTLALDGIFNVLKVSDQRWRSEENPGAGKISESSTWKWQREISTNYLYDGSHLWVKNVSLGYNLPKTITKQYGVRLYISSDNLFLLTKYPGGNPDVISSEGDGDLSFRPSFDYGSSPVPRIFTIGGNFTF